MKIILPSPAKINLSLWVNGKREDGYHNILTVFHTINLFDYISIQRSGHLELNVAGSTSVPAGGDNLIIKACDVFYKHTGIKPKVSITLDKKIPVGAGLGGGSSNAAVVLKGLNQLYDFPVDDEKLVEMASEIGSDVAFFIKGGLAIGCQRGEKLTFYGSQNFDILLVFPNIFCSTAEVYKNLPPLNRNMEIEDAERLILIPLMKRDYKTLRKNMWNDLELSQADCVRKVMEVKKTIEDSVETRVIMSGSGSSLFAVLDKGKKEKIDITPLQRKGWWVKFLSAI
ncbi:4-(cytidine 5'-diphospho)-2-C-methyl-D-erythritol kinase [Desulfurobacterium atlanticum]|uniref:4-diphosphocytidyl-2-C-methyl-D-erythritol kinase n=1 Tax=Desulfurobacterium atlanticum TaxID=240169 RepID=A0A238YWM2_9BACT|nr:4-(cytidine 5'-diphospho)-2-C-methyl-D-erythritol kinase [Desulfurobacterium atlanticum]SNR75158.1 4-diphosphocytidyl-2-C-methyl-D-erythritol kinase [Desulfurobacterium atlanticum]